MSTGPYPWSAGFRSFDKELSYRMTEVEGEVPAGLRGTLLHNGPGRNELAGQWFAHSFDGDGMLTAVRFADDGIHFRNRYVATPSYLAETRAQRILTRGFGKMRPGGVLANAFRLPANVANTSLVLEDDRILALWEGGPPTALDAATLDTRGLEDFGGKARAFSAHPKRDPDTGDLWNFGLDYGRHCTITPYRLSRGTLTTLPKVTLPYAVMNHDFVLTRNHLVFCVGPILSDSLGFLLGRKSLDASLHWDGGKPTLIVLVPRDGGPARIVETEPFFQFHFANAYEENGAIHIDVARYPDYHAIGKALREFWHAEFPAAGMATMTRLSLDLASGRVTRRAWDTDGHANEFPFVNPARVSGKHRFVYFLRNPPDRLRGLQQQVARLDCETGTLACHDFGPDGWPAEPCFVPMGTGDEDDGVVLTIVFDSGRQCTKIVGLDARDLAGKPLFTAHLPHAVPFCLHGLFTPRQVGAA